MIYNDKGTNLITGFCVLFWTKWTILRLVFASLII